jgi:hypothetical protein
MDVGTTRISVGSTCEQTDRGGTTNSDGAGERTQTTKQIPNPFPA